MEKQQKFSKICLIYFISLVCFVLIRIASSLGLFKLFSDVVADTIFTLVVQLLIMGILPFLLYILIYKKQKINKQSIKEGLSDIGFKKLSIKSVVIAIILGICVYVFNIMIASVFDMILAIFGYESGSSGSSNANTQTWFLFLSLLLTAVLPGVFEEILHRGILQKGVRDTKNFKWVLLCSGLFFGLMHLNVNQFFYATIIGIFFAFIAYITNNIWPSIILHFMNNAINVYLSFTNVNNGFGQKFYSTLNSFLQNNNIVVTMIFITCLMLVLSLITAWLVVALYNDNNKNKKIYLKLLTPAYMKNYLSVKKKDISEPETSLNYSQYVSRENDVMPADPDFSSLFNIDNSKSEKFSFKYSIFFYAIIILGGLTTLFTFIWGIL